MQAVTAKIRKVMEVVKRVEKDGQMNYGQKYKYISEEQITGTLHDAFVDVGLTIAPTAMEPIYDGSYVASGGATMILARIRVTYTITDPESGEFICVQALGEGADVGDKSYNKAMTAAYKYALRQTFMLSSGDDPDHEPSQPAQGAPQQQSKPSGPRNPDEPASDKQLDLIKNLRKQKFGEDKDAANACLKRAIGRVPKSLNELTKGDASKLIEAMMALPNLIGDGDTDPFADE